MRLSGRRPFALLLEHGVALPDPAFDLGDQFPFVAASDFLVRDGRAKMDPNIPRQGGQLFRSRPCVEGPFQGNG
jgi:hypothetical protein